MKNFIFFAIGCLSVALMSCSNPTQNEDIDTFFYFGKWEVESIVEGDAELQDGGTFIQISDEAIISWNRNEDSSGNLIDCFTSYEQKVVSHDESNDIIITERESIGTGWYELNRSTFIFERISDSRVNVNYNLYYEYIYGDNADIGEEEITVILVRSNFDFEECEN